MTRWSEQTLASPWLQAADLRQDGVDTIVKIASLEKMRVRSPGSSREEDKWALLFQGLEKPLLIGAKCNARSLQTLFGDEMQACIGRLIALYVDQSVRRPDGTTGPAIRIRQQHPVMATMSPKYQQRVREAMKQRGMSLDHLLTGLSYIDQDAFEQAHGKELADWPQTRQVIDAIAAVFKRHDAPDEPAEPLHKPIREEDIPF